MIEVRELRSGELEQIGQNAAEPWVREFIKGQDLTPLLANPLSYCILLDDAPIAAGGFSDRGDGFAVCWSIVGQVPRRMFVRICRIAQRILAVMPFDLIECHCHVAFVQSHRWVEILGFRRIDGIINMGGREFYRYVYRGQNGY